MKKLTNAQMKQVCGGGVLGWIRSLIDDIRRHAQG